MTIPTVVEGRLASGAGRLWRTPSAPLPNVFAPFSKRVWLRTVVERELVRAARLAAAEDRSAAVPRRRRAAVDAGVVLNGELDQSTPVADARHVPQRSQRDAVQVPNTGHLSALYDFQHWRRTSCRTVPGHARAGSTACATCHAALNVAAFPRTLGDRPEADGGRVEPPGAQGRLGRAGPSAMRSPAGTTSCSTIRGHGSGGCAPSPGDPEPLAALDPLRPARGSSDMAVSGWAVWDRRAWRVHARLRLSGAAAGVLRVSFATDATGAVATISGRVGQRTVHLQTPAPWAPQG